MNYELTVPTYCEKLISRLQSSGFAAYAVGGAIRDSVMRRGKPEDWDVATSARPEEVMELFPHSIPTGLKHGTVTVVTDGHTVEVTTFRKDEGHSDSRHPDSVVFVDTIEEDLLRRDFTMNALAYDPISHALIDIVGGLGDIERRIIRTVGDPETRFNEDRLRMLRAIRFATVLGFSIDGGVLAAIRSGRTHILRVSWERIRDEFLKILTSERSAQGIELMRVTGILNEVIPELPTGTELACEECGARTVYEHGLLVCEQIRNDVSLRLAALLHDIGQCAGDSRSLENRSRRSVEMAFPILKRLRLPSRIIDKTCHLIRLHIISYSPEWSDGTVRRIASYIGRENIDEFLEFKKADLLVQGHQAKVRLDNLYRFEKRIQMLIDEATVLTIDGLDIDGRNLQQLGLEEGPMIGEMLNRALDLVIESPEKNKREVLIDYIKKLGVD